MWKKRKKKRFIKTTLLGTTITLANRPTWDLATLSDFSAATRGFFWCGLAVCVQPSCFWRRHGRWVWSLLRITWLHWDFSFLPRWYNQLWLGSWVLASCPRVIISSDLIMTSRRNLQAQHRLVFNQLTLTSKYHRLFWGKVPPLKFFCTNYLVKVSFRLFCAVWRKLKLSEQQPNIQTSTKEQIQFYSNSILAKFIITGQVQHLADTNMSSCWLIATKCQYHVKRGGRKNTNNCKTGV